jgi:hypothetical protein
MCPAVSKPSIPGMGVEEDHRVVLGEQSLERVPPLVTDTTSTASPSRMARSASRFSRIVDRQHARTAVIGPPAGRRGGVTQLAMVPAARRGRRAS